MAKLERCMSPEFVTPLALFLVSDQCQTTHSAYSAVAGRYARIFTGMAKGWRGALDDPSSPEDIAAQWQAIDVADDFTIPSTAFDELTDIIRR
jgi:hypothetical protein